MTDDELRLAAGALLAEIDTYARDYDRYEYGLPLDVEHMAELVAIVRPYLAAGPADDGEPVTEEWARSAGAARTFDDEPLSLFWWFTPTERWSTTFVKVTFEADGKTSMGICGSTLAYNPARGRVRRLLTALGATP